MTAPEELHRRAKELVLGALERPLSERSAWVEHACAGDSELLREVSSLLAEANAGDDDFLERPAVLVASASMASATSDDSARAASPHANDRDPLRLAPGTLLADRFEIVALRGEGGMGTVYEAYDRTLGETVAVKVMRPARQADAEWRDRFRREVLLARRISHPNVCRIHDLYQHTVPEVPAAAGDDGGAGAEWLLAMELLRGENLAERLRRERCLDEALVASLLEQLAAGLDAAHRAGVVHRDLKTSNVMLLGDAAAPRAVITDFGVARAFAGAGSPDDGDPTLTAAGQLVGTPVYMAPEQLLGQPVTPATDQRRTRGRCLRDVDRAAPVR